MLTKVRCVAGGPSRVNARAVEKMRSGNRVGETRGKWRESQMEKERGLKREEREGRRALRAGGGVSVRRVGAGVGVVGARGYATGEDGKDKKKEEKAEGGKQQPRAKKVGNTASTLSNLENLYAAFAKQQKEKAKATEQGEVAADAAKRGVKLEGEGGVGQVQQQASTGSPSTTARSGRRYSPSSAPKSESAGAAAAAASTSSEGGDSEELWGNEPHPADELTGAAKWKKLGEELQLETEVMRAAEIDTEEIWNHVLPARSGMASNMPEYHRLTSELPEFEPVQYQTKKGFEEKMDEDRMGEMAQYANMFAMDERSPEAIEAEEVATTIGNRLRKEKSRAQEEDPGDYTGNGAVWSEMESPIPFGASTPFRPRRDEHGRLVSTPRTLSDLATIEEDDAVRSGMYDPTSPQALERKRRNQPILPSSEEEALSIEHSLITRHRSAVESTSAQMIKEFDLSSSVHGMAPLTSAQNPYLYNETFSIGLTDTELEWLQTRPAWQALVDAKRTNVALQQRDMRQDRDLVDSLFIDVVNRLSQGPQSGSWIHPDDIKAQHAALEARQRLQTKLTEIYTSSPAQWAALLHKYLPSHVDDRMAEHVMNREFWSPSNPWLLTAFTKQLVEEAQYMSKQTDESSLEEEITERMIDQGTLREDDNNDAYSVGPLGQSDGLNSDERLLMAGADDGSRDALKGCLFCSEHRHRFPLDPMNVPLLARHMNLSGQILPRAATGLCKKHQAKVARTIKHARHLNLFTHKKSLYRINNVFKSPTEWVTPDLDVQIYRDPLKVAKREPEKIEVWADQMLDRHIEDASYAPEHDNLILPESQMDDIDLVDDRDAEEELWDMTDELVEDLNSPAFTNNIVSAIESLAYQDNEENSRLANMATSEGLMEAESSSAAAPSKSQKHDQTSPLHRKQSSFSIDSFDSANDDIGDTMVKSALSKMGKLKSNLRRDKDSL